MADAGLTLCSLLAQQAEAAGDYRQALEHTRNARTCALQIRAATQAAHVVAKVPLTAATDVETQLLTLTQNIERLQQLAGKAPGK